MQIYGPTFYRSSAQEEITIAQSDPGGASNELSRKSGKKVVTRNSYVNYGKAGLLVILRMQNRIEENIPTGNVRRIVLRSSSETCK